MHVLQLRNKCSSCGNDADFCVTQIGELLLKDPITAVKVEFAVRGVNSEPDNLVEARGMSRCPICNHPSLVLFETTKKSLQKIVNANPPSARGLNVITTRADVTAGQARILATFPRIETRVAHPAWPAKVHTLFLELQDAIDKNRHAGLIISGCRSVLDVATKVLHSREESQLKNRIDALAQAGVVTGTLREWAHQLRLDGNAAVHEMSGTPEEARELVEFVKLFLQVCFELPAAIAAKRAQRASEQTNEPTAN